MITKIWNAFRGNVWQPLPSNMTVMGTPIYGGDRAANLRVRNASHATDGYLFGVRKPDGTAMVKVHEDHHGEFLVRGHGLIAFALDKNGHEVPLDIVDWVKPDSSITSLLPTLYS